MSGVTIDDRRFRELMRRLPDEDAQVKVGVLRALGGGDKEAGGDATVADVALIHEFGDGDIPERSFIRSTLAQREPELQRMMGALIGQIVEGNLSSDRAHDLLGAYGAGEIKKAVAEGPHIPPPLAESTVKRKGSSRPLVDTGQLVGAIGHEVES